MLMWHHQQTSTKNLSGWAAIEDSLLKYDLGRVKDYTDDIDTLLVFVSPRAPSL